MKGFGGIYADFGVEICVIVCLNELCVLWTVERSGCYCLRGLGRVESPIRAVDDWSHGRSNLLIALVRGKNHGCDRGSGLDCDRGWFHVMFDFYRGWFCCDLGMADFGVVGLSASGADDLWAGFRRVTDRWG